MSRQDHAYRNALQAARLGRWRPRLRKHMSRQDHAYRNALQAARLGRWRPRLRSSDVRTSKRGAEVIDSRFLTTLTRGQKVGLPRARGVAKSDFGAPRRSFRLALPLLQYTVDDSLGQPTDTTIASSRRPANLVSPLSWQVRGSPSPPAPRPPRSGWAWQPDHPLPFHAATPAEDRLPGPGHSTSVYAAPR
jgi:hypothetical protein